MDTPKPIFDDSIDFVKNYKAMFGEQALDLIYRFKIIERLLEKQNKPHLFYQILKNFLFTISSQDPTKFHYEIVRKAIAKIDEKELHNTQAINLLAGAFVETCNKFNKKLKLTESLDQLIINCRKEDPDKNEIPSYYLDFVECPEANDDFEKQFFKENGLSIWDNIYLKILESTGKEGRKRAKEFSEKIKKKKDGWDQQFWFQNATPDDPFFHSPALIILASALWQDDVKKRIKFSNKNVPALTTSVQNPISKMLAPKNKVLEHENNIQVFHQDSLLGIISIPTIPQNIISTVFNGVQKLNTVTGHRFTRHLVVNAFEQMINGNSDYRVLKRDRGATDIADELGLKGNKHITNIKEILHAMAYFEFRGHQLSGNLIQLSKYKSPITGRKDEGYLITIGTPLLPYQTFEAYKNGSCSLLIPLLKDPPLVGSSRSHAGQYLLQMNLMGEFSKNSVQLARSGAIQLSQQKLEEFAKACDLTSEVLIKIIDRWTQDGDDGAKFIEKVEDDFYTLGPEHQKALEFLQRQGELRIEQSNRGKSSAIKREQARNGKKRKL
jgi:hypothetical protein